MQKNKPYLAMIVLAAIVGGAILVNCTGCGSIIGIGTTILDNSPALNQRLDDRWRNHFAAEPQDVAKVHAVTTLILDQFDGPPATTTGAAIKIAGVAINVKKLSLPGQAVLKRVGQIIEGPIIAFAAKYGIIDQGALADLVGRALKRANRIASEIIKSKSASITGAMDSQALACDRCGHHQPATHNQRGGDTLSGLLSDKGSTMHVRANNYSPLRQEWTTV